MKIRGNTVGTPMPRSNWNQTDPKKADFILNKPTIPAEQVQSDWAQTDSTKKDFIKNKPTPGQLGAATTAEVQAAQTTANEAKTAASNAQSTANEAKTAAATAQSTANSKADGVHRHTVSDITDLTVTATELNYVDGVTSNIQEQLNAIASGGVGGKTPYISNGYWYIDGVSTGVKAEGVDGKDGKDGVDGKTPYISMGYWYIDGVSTGVKAEGTTEVWTFTLEDGSTVTKAVHVG